MNKFANICVGIGTISLSLAITLLICSEAALNYHKSLEYEAETNKERLEFEKITLEIQQLKGGVKL